VPPAYALLGAAAVSSLLDYGAAAGRQYFQRLLRIDAVLPDADANHLGKGDGDIL
jgi:hypothetical protein